MYHAVDSETSEDVSNSERNKNKAMDNSEIATKAPESDADEEPLISGNNDAQGGPSMGVSQALTYY